MTRVNGYSVIILRTTLADVSPVSILFSEVETGSIGDESPSEEPASESKPANYREDQALGGILKT